MKQFAALLLSIIVWSAVALAQAPPDLEREIAAASRSLNDLSEDLRADGVDDRRLFEREVRDIIAISRERLRPVEDALGRAEGSLSLLGPAPKEGEPAEAAALAAERAELVSRVSTARGQRTRILATIDQGSALLGELSERRLRDLYRKIFNRGTPLVAPELWPRAASDFNALSGAMGRHFANWREQRASSGGVLLPLGGLAAALLLSVLMYGPVRKWMRRAFTARIEKHEPTAPRRVAVAGVKMLSRLILGVIGGLFVIETSRAFGLLGPEGVPVARAIWIALIAYLLVDGFTNGLFAPSAPGWRLAEIDAAKARLASALLVSIVVIVGAKSVIAEIAMAANGADSFTRVINGVAAVAVGGLLFMLCRKRLWAPAPAVEPPLEPLAENETAIQGPWPVVRLGGRALAVFIVLAALTGFVSLADFAATRLYFLGLVLALAWFLRAALRETAAWADRRLSAGRGDTAKKEETQAFRFWVGSGIDLVLLLLLAPMLFILAGVDWTAVRDFFLRALIGFRIGGVVISLSEIFIAVAVFVGILALTRVVQGVLQRGPLAHSNVDSGIQNSLTTLFGYGGLVVALVAGLAMLGADLSNLALIAGALSVGIGFGLQSIVNNFVSGLILLFERPIKVGDWIVTTSGQGIVKKISVRSTEIETFDRSSIIVPNSELVASTVTNWTHKTTLGRVRVPVGVSYNSDPEKVREILLKCANDHPLVVRYPEAFVVWEDFGASSLDFELRAFIGDIIKRIQVRTDLRFAIFRAFNEEGIEFPFPQQDIHIRSMPGDQPKPPKPAAPPTPGGTPPPESDEGEGDGGDD